MKQTRTSHLLFALIAALCTTGPVAAQEEGVRIAAVVNDQVISIADLSARVGLVFSSSNIPNTPDTRARVEAQVMRQMIDEKLELAEAKHEGITVDDEDIQHQLASLAHANHLAPGDLPKFLSDHHIDKDALADQIRAQIAWARVVQRRYGHTVSVGEDEIDDALKAIEQDRTKPQNHIAEIFLSVDTPQQDDEVHQLASHLFDQIRQGTSFAAVARQFSQSPTASSGGDLGWVLPGMLDTEAQKVIDTMQPGMLTKPLRMAGGYYLYYLIDRRMPDLGVNNVNLDLAQVVFPLVQDADAATRTATEKKAADATADMHSCGEMAKLGKRISPDLSGPISNIALTELPPEIRPLVVDIEIATPTKPLAVRGGIGVYMVCRREGGPPKVARDQVEDSLRAERLENIARRYLADLRRVAYIDLRV